LGTIWSHTVPFEELPSCLGRMPLLRMRVHTIGNISNELDKWTGQAAQGSSSDPRSPEMIDFVHEGRDDNQPRVGELRHSRLDRLDSFLDRTDIYDDLWPLIGELEGDPHVNMGAVVLTKTDRDLMLDQKRVRLRRILLHLLHQRAQERLL